MSSARIMPWVVGMWLEYTLRCQPSLLSATFWVLRVPLNGGQTHAGFGTPKMCPDAKIMWTFFRDQILSPLNARWMVRIFTTLLRFWGVFQCTQSNPSPYPRNNVGRVYPEFLPSFSFVYGGGRKNCRKMSKRMHCFKREPRNDWKIWILKYCPKDFCPGL